MSHVFYGFPTTSRLDLVPGFTELHERHGDLEVALALHLLDELNTHPGPWDPPMALVAINQLAHEYNLTVVKVAGTLFVAVNSTHQYREEPEWGSFDLEQPSREDHVRIADLQASLADDLDLRWVLTN